MLGLIQWVVVGVIGLRLVELIYSHRNTVRLLARGGVEYGKGHYPLFVLLHASWLVALLIFIPSEQPPNVALLALFILLQFARVWVLYALGPYWSTRVISAPDFPRIRRGPYRWFKHPNYWVVVGEIAVLPLAFDAYWIALVFSALNALLLWWRIRLENRVLAERSDSHAESTC